MSVELNTVSWGSGPRSILLLHGITSNAAGWWRLGPALAEAGFTAVAPDLRGHGGSPRGDDQLLSSHVADVGRLAERWDVVLGHSMGGAVALLAAADRPGWTGQLILEDPVITLPDLPAVVAWLTPDFYGDISPDALHARFPEWDRQDAEAKADALAACGPEIVEMAFTQNDPWDLREALRRVEVPTTIIGADPDQGSVIPTFFGEELATLPHVDFTQVMGSHSMHRDRWDEFWATLSALLEVPA